MVQRMRQPCLPDGAWNTLTLPSWLQITTPCTDYCIIVVLASVLLLVRRFTCSLCLAHHLKQNKKNYQFSILFLFLLFYKNRFAKEICTCNVFYSSWLQFISSRYARRQCMLMMSSNDIPVKVQWHQRH